MPDLAGLRRRAYEVGYRMLGSRSEAEDIAQEALIRATGDIERGEVRNPEAFVTTIATRLAIDELRSARVRRERYVGPWLPEPAIEPIEGASTTSDSLSYSLMVVLETLSPIERAAFLLHDVFGYSYGELAEAIGRSETACRQLASRARRRVGERRPRLPVDEKVHRALLERFLAAATAGDLNGLRGMLCDDVVFVSDGGGNARAARRPIVGRDRVAALIRKVCSRWTGTEIEIVRINGSPGFVIRRTGSLLLAGNIEVDGQSISATHWIRNPEKLPHPIPRGAGALHPASGLVDCPRRPVWR